MKALITSVLLILFTLPSYASDLPPCRPDLGDSYHDCKGSYTTPDGDAYYGFWKYGRYHGWGMLTKKTDGSMYIGWWKDGKRHGKGTYAANGDKYVGEFKDGEFHGKGNLTYSDGTVKSGIWDNGKYLNESVESARSDCAREAGKAGTEYAAKKIEEACLEQKGYGKAWYEW